MKLFRILALAVACAAASTATTLAATVQAEDLYKLTLLGSALISPDGAHVLVEASKMNGPKDNYDRTIDLIDVQSGKLTPNVTGRMGDGDYDWMPDGASFVFVRTLDKAKPQLFRYTLATGTIVQLTHFTQGVSSPNVSHDGKRIALTVTDKDTVDNAYIDFSKAGFTPTDAQKKTDIHKIHTLFFQANGQGYVYQDHPHIWTIAADGSNSVQVTSGNWGEGFVGWSPDDRTIAFNSTRYENIDSGASDVYVVASTGGDASKMTSTDPSNNGAFFGTDGATIYTLRGGVKDSAELPALVVSKPDGSESRIVVATNQVSWGDTLLADMKEEGGGLCGGPLPGGTQALLNIDGPGYSNLRLLNLTNGSLADLTPPKGEAWSCSVSRDGKTVAYLYSDATHPADVYVANVPAAAPRQLTNVNQAYLASVTLSVPVPLDVKDASGNTVQAWFMPAIGGKPGDKRPTLLDIHGGPETQFGDTFFQEFQYLAGLGYNIVFSDPAGSTGHGYAFEEALESNYGDAMFQDVEAAMNAAAKRDDVDSTRLGVLGGSYGGYATLWVVSHTNRYKAAVAERVVSFMQSENLTADFAGKGGLAGGTYSMGSAWDPASAACTPFSPLTYVAQVQTPLLILHSDMDTRTPIDQTLQEFTALKILGRTVEYVAVPNETHDLSRTGSPLHRVERLHIISDWMGKYLSP